MKIELKEILVRDLVEGYVNDEEEGVRGYSDRLDIRPPYQREFIYKDKQRAAVIETVRKDFPLNTMYWVKNGEDAFELLDGQQRTLSVCEYVAGTFSLNHQYFHNLEEEEQEQILTYRLTVYVCEGEDREKLDWFRTINIAGVKLADQELRNAVYTGPWLANAKKYFSKTGCVAYEIAQDYMKGSPIRQDFLETTLDWISDGNIEQYMAKNQHEPNANELWLYFQSVISWVKTVFPKVRKEMRSVPWGTLYQEFKDDKLDGNQLEKEIVHLMTDEDVTKKSGAYYYVLTRDEKWLSIRAFTDRQKREAFERQNGVCTKCGKQFELAEMQGDHITPWSQGGRTVSSNCQMLCKEDNRTKSDQ